MDRHFHFFHTISHDNNNNNAKITFLFATEENEEGTFFRNKLFLRDVEAMNGV